MPPKRESLRETIADEEEIGTEGRGNLWCRVQADGAARSYIKQNYIELQPGCCFRVSIGVRPRGGGRTEKVARVLAFIDPLTGNLVTRMGMFDISETKQGKEVGPQIVDVSDVPVCDLDSPDE